MADEVIIVEMTKPSGAGTNGNIMNVFGDIITTQVLDIATVSAELNSSTEMVQIISKGTGFWYKTGATAALAAATADTDGNVWLKADGEHPLEAKNFKFIDTAADA